MQPEIANDPRQVLFLDDVVGIGGPEALRVKILERPAREFEPALAGLRSFLRRVHADEISAAASGGQVASSQPQTLPSTAKSREK